MEVTGIVLAGGQGRRMGGVDKGLVEFRGMPMVAHVLQRLEPQVDALLLNANRAIDIYSQFGYPVISDSIPGFAGPLAGLQSGMARAGTPLVAMVPCDAPLLPDDLVSRLLEALQMHGADLACVRTGRWQQPAFCLCRTALLPDLTRFLQGGGRKVGAWYASLDCVEVAFDDQAGAFVNLNTPEELACLDQ
jgi:molybdenum cofactor guanylyltransferase